MLLTITNTTYPATDLGYLLHRDPAHVRSFALSFGNVHLFYPRADATRCTVALLLDVDPVGLVRRHRGPFGSVHPLAPYINDRPYVVSSFMSMAIGRAFGDALAGKSGERPALVEKRLSLQVLCSSLPCRDGEPFLRRLFTPLGYDVEMTRQLLDPEFPEWGLSRYYTVKLSGDTTVRDLLEHLYVLIPVTDDDKHSWILAEEIEKLMRHGERWLVFHPDRAIIARRYLKHRRSYVREALSRIISADASDHDIAALDFSGREADIEKNLGLDEKRLSAVVNALKKNMARRVLDLGCGEGRLLRRLLDDDFFKEITGVDVSIRALEAAKEYLRLDRLPTTQRDRVRLIQGSLVYLDRRLSGYDAVTVLEVIEHLDRARLPVFERILFEFARPATVIITTPNTEYNIRFPSLPAGTCRHRGHRFEWTRREFRSWAIRMAEQYDYTVSVSGIGPDDSVVGTPTLMGIFNIV
jgi:3' terminal RNA ribose 2'-O-methyltransferase Hen1